MISDFRQAAIEALKALEEKPKALEDDYDFGRRQMLETCIDIIQDLQPSPSAQPERKTGKPVVKSTGYRGYWACDQCGTEIKRTDDFRRHCGADLRGEQE